MGAPRKYPPPNAIEDIERLACKGWSTIGLAKHFGVSRPTVQKWLDENQKFEDAYEQGRDMYRQALEEQIIQMTLSGQGKSVAGLIYLLKAKFKMYDVPNNKPDAANLAVEVQNVLVVKDHGTDEEWAAKAAEQQRRLVANSGDKDSIVEAKPALPAPPDTSGTPVAPAWMPKRRK